MKKTLSILLTAFVLLGSTSLVWAEDVFVTQRGKKYHHAESGYIKGKDVIKMDKKEAEEKGYLPSRSYLKFKAKEESKKDK